MSTIVILSSTNELPSREINLLTEESEAPMKLDHKRPRRKATWKSFWVNWNGQGAWGGGGGRGGDALQTRNFDHVFVQLPVTFISICFFFQTCFELVAIKQSYVRMSILIYTHQTIKYGRLLRFLSLFTNKTLLIVVQAKDFQCQGLCY